MELLAWPAAAAAAGGVPPVRGLSRCLCLLLFLLGPNKLSPWTAPEAVAARPELVRPAGLLPAVLPLGVLMHPAGLQSVRAATRAAFVLAAVGLGGGLPVAAAAAGWFWLTNALACVMPEKACVSPKKFLVPAWTLALIAALVPPPLPPHTHPRRPIQNGARAARGGDASRQQLTGARLAGQSSCGREQWSVDKELAAYFGEPRPESSLTPAPCLLHRLPLLKREGGPTS